MLAFTALDCFRYCLLRANEWPSPYPFPEFFEPVRLPYYLAIISGTLFATLVMRRLKDVLSAAFHPALVLMLICAASSLWLSGMSKLIMMFLSFFLESALMCLCLSGISLYADFASLGRLITFSFTISYIIGGGFLLLESAPPVAHAFILAIFSMSIIPIKLKAAGENAVTSPSEQKLEPLPSGGVIRGFMAVLIIYNFIAGVLYNLFFISEGAVGQPGLYFLILIASAGIYVIIGRIIDKAPWHITLTSLFALITVGKSLSFFFSSESLIALPFSYITLGGFTALDAVAIIIPLYYIKKMGRHHLSSSGCLFLYSGLFITTLLLKLAPESLYRAILGAMLIASPAAMLLVVGISSSYARAKADYLLKIAESARTRPALEERIERYGLTNREEEVLRYLLEGKSTSEIAEVMSITARTVQNYINTLMAKTGTNSRIKTLALFARQDP